MKTILRITFLLAIPVVLAVGSWGVAQAQPAGEVPDSWVPVATEAQCNCQYQISRKFGVIENGNCVVQDCWRPIQEEPQQNQQ